MIDNIWRYHWVILLSCFMALTICFIGDSIKWLYAPQLVDIIWNDTLHMLEPIYIGAPIEMIEQNIWVSIILIPMSFFDVWFSSPIYISVSYGLLLLWFGIFIWSHVPDPSI